MLNIAPRSQAEPAAIIETKARPLPRARRTTADRVRASLLAITAGRGAIVTHAETAWASITFSGTRHEIAMAFCGAEDIAAGEELISALPDHEFAIPGQLVADATITSVDHRFGADERLELTAVLLLLEES